MALLRAEVTLPMTTDRPRDVAMNTFYWTCSGDPTDADFLAISFELDSFYNLAVDSLIPEADTWAVKDFLSPVLKRGESVGRVRFTDITGADPVPLVETQIPLEASDIDPQDALPNEIALVLSFSATPLLPTPIKNRRGRVYIGPLGQSCVGESTIGDVPYPVANTFARGVLMESAKRMAQGPTTVLWQVYSRTLEQNFEVSQGHVDNEFDTMRSRQYEATVRTSWTL